MRPPTFQPASADPTIQLSIGQALAPMRAVDESSRGIFGSFDARTDAGEDLAGLPMANRAEIHQHVVWCRERCVEIAAELFRLGGASSIYGPNILQRRWRDVSIMGQHAYVGTASHLHGAQLAFGEEVVAPLL